MANPRQRLGMPSLYRQALGLTLGCLLLLSASVRADHGQDVVGDPQAPGLTLYVPVMPTIVDPTGQLLPQMRKWLAQVAVDANIHIKIQAANYERRLADMERHSSDCVLGYARLPEREATARWLAVVRRDRIVFVARRDDPFAGSLAAFLKLADGNVAAPSGIYRSVLESHGIDYLAVDDQRALARMVDAGRIRFGMLIGGSLDAPEMQALTLHVVAELPPQQFWFACNPAFPEILARRLTLALRSGKAEALRRIAMNEDHPGGPAIQ
jgi:hypothetical protein